MDARETKRILKDVLTEYGFVLRGKRYYKPVSEGYSLVILLDKYFKQYSIDLGAVFEPATSVCDIADWFLFTTEPETSLEACDLMTRTLPRGSTLTNWFDYENRSAEEFRASLRRNLETKLPRWQNPEYALDRFRKDWILFRTVSDDVLEKIARLAGLDADEVRKVRDGNRRKWPREYFDGSDFLHSLAGCRLVRCFRASARADLLLEDDAGNRQFELRIQCGMTVTRNGTVEADFRDLLPKMGEMMVYNPQKPKESPVAFDRDMAEFVDREQNHRISAVAVAGEGGFDIVFDDESRIHVFPETEDVHEDIWSIKAECLPGLLFGSKYGCWYE